MYEEADRQAKVQTKGLSWIIGASGLPAPPSSEVTAAAAMCGGNRCAPGPVQAPPTDDDLPNAIWQSLKFLDNEEDDELSLTLLGCNGYSAWASGGQTQSTEVPDRWSSSQSWESSSNSNVAQAHCEQAMDWQTCQTPAGYVAQKALICSCGMAIMPDSRFCVLCGSIVCGGEQNLHLAWPNNVLDGLCKCGTAFHAYGRFCSGCGISKQAYEQRIDVEESTPESSARGKSVEPFRTSHMGGQSQNQSDWVVNLHGLDSDHPSIAPQFSMEGDNVKVSLDKLNPDVEITTMMLCDIPCRRTVEQVIEAIDMHGFIDTYDLVYMPHQKGRRTPSQSHNMGYAFVNFKKQEWAMSFMGAFNNFRFPGSSSAKVSYAKPAHCQGFTSNLDMHKKKVAVGTLLTFPQAVAPGPV
jgi:hypothetical protein